MTSIERESTVQMIERTSNRNRVTPQQIADAIACEYTFTAAAAVGQEAPQHDSLRLLTLCILVLRNGFTIVGKSACADPENFDPVIGIKLAREDAIEQVWPLLGYELRTQLQQAQVSVNAA